MSSKIFGTDGIRGQFGSHPITEEFAFRLGKAAFAFASMGSLKPISICIGRDTRASGSLLVAHFSAAFVEAGGNVHDLGIVPTPVVALMAKETDATLGLAVTASHNPFHDNGFKFFSGEGKKLPTETEEKFEKIITESTSGKLESNGSFSNRSNEAIESYFAHLDRFFPKLDLHGLKIGIDCSNGATFNTSPAYLRRKGAEVIHFGTEPDGKNINENCGSEHPDHLSELIKKEGCQIGLAHDGDGDRLIVLDESGSPLSGEHFMSTIVKHSTSVTEKLVTTIQSNLALDVFLKSVGIETVRTPVGDRNVGYELFKGSAEFGGENSGHYIFKDVLPTGDGLIAALKFLEVLITSDKPVSHFHSDFSLFPSRLKNIPVPHKPPLESLSGLSTQVQEIEDLLSGRGRVLVRYSGTEPKIRLLVEAESIEVVDASLRKIEEALCRDFKVEGF